MSRTEDYYAREAKKRGYPARSVFKLEEIQSKFRLIRRGSLVLDIGASPGSWSLYIMKELGARVVGVDLKTPVTALDRKEYSFIRGDIFEDKVWERISKFGPYQAVMSDAAPSTTGTRSIDSIRSFSLAERVFDVASASLEKGGNLVVKIFQGGEERELLMRMKDFFSKTAAFKPRASRKSSFEIYLIGTGFF
jgi:23S rRNA (uridine2552-2'-O)-methyltransferase